MINVFIPHRWNNDDYEAMELSMESEKFILTDKPHSNGSGEKEKIIEMLDKLVG